MLSKIKIISISANKTETFPVDDHCMVRRVFFHLLGVWRSLFRVIFPLVCW
jgi:hypothetical protein